MIRWSVGTNDVYMEAHIYREEGPWWVFFIEWIGMKSCDFIPCLPLPNLSITRDSFLGDEFLEENEITTLKKHYGNLHDLYHWKICTPIFQWCDNKYARTVAMIDLDDVPKEWIYQEEEEHKSNNVTVYSPFKTARDEERKKRKERLTFKKQIIGKIQKQRKNNARV